MQRAADSFAPLMVISVSLEESVSIMSAFNQDPSAQVYRVQRLETSVSSVVVDAPSVQMENVVISSVLDCDI